MIVRTIDEIIGTENETTAETWSSRRFLLKKDGMGFSYSETKIIWKRSIVSVVTVKSKLLQMGKYTPSKTAPCML